MLFLGKIKCSIKYRVLTDTSPLVGYKAAMRFAREHRLLLKSKENNGNDLTPRGDAVSKESLEWVPSTWPGTNSPRWRRECLQTSDSSTPSTFKRTWSQPCKRRPSKVSISPRSISGKIAETFFICQLFSRCTICAENVMHDPTVSLLICSDQKRCFWTRLS